MLTYFTIQNYTLIDTLRFEPAKGLNILTGETGAGKSILLEALHLLAGAKSENIQPPEPEKKCILEAGFDISDYNLKNFFTENDLDYEPVTLIRREIVLNGKSRSFINDTPVSLSVIKNLFSELVDFHSQHEKLQLSTAGFILKTVDAFSETWDLLSNHKKHYEEWKKAEEKFLSLSAEATRAKKEFDFLSFQLKELASANLTEGELEKAEESLKVLTHSEEIKQKLGAVLEILSRTDESLLSRISVMTRTLSELNSLSPVYDTFRKRIETAMIELKDVGYELESLEEKTEYDPEKIQLLTDRIDRIYSLLKKHNVKQVAELIALREELESTVNRTVKFEEELELLQKEKEQLFQKLVSHAKKLSAERVKNLPLLEKKLTRHLQEVGMPNSRLSFERKETPVQSTGMDTIQLLFSANKGMEIRELSEVASGGELSRLLLCIKCILAEKRILPTLVFDEIDTGISGEVALRTGDLLETMAKKHQIISITHLPQIAAKGQAHFRVYKEIKGNKTFSRLQKLDEKDRIAEIAQMVSGKTPAKTAGLHARELLGLGRQTLKVSPAPGLKCHR